MPRRVLSEPADALRNSAHNSATAASLAADATDQVPGLSDAERAGLAIEVDAAIRDLRRVRRALAAPVRTCEVCGVRFTGRADARYHSDACRQYAHRLRVTDSATR